MLSDLLGLVGQGIAFAYAHERGQLAGFAIGGLAAAVACFFLCGRFARLWNRQIQLSTSHHVWSAVAGIVTVVLAMFLAGVMHLGEVANLRVHDWTQSLGTASVGEEISEAQYQALVAAGYPQPDYRRPPSEGGSILLLGDGRAQEIYARTMADVAMRRFEQHNPALHLLIGSRDEQAVRAVVADQSQFFAARKHMPNPDRYPLAQAVRVLQHEMETEFAAQIPVFQRRALVLAIVLALLAQALPIVLSGLAAYRQIRIRPARGARDRVARSNVRPRRH